MPPAQLWGWPAQLRAAPPGPRARPQTDGSLAALGRTASAAFARGAQEKKRPNWLQDDPGALGPLGGRMALGARAPGPGAREPGPRGPGPGRGPGAREAPKIAVQEPLGMVTLESPPAGGASGPGAPPLSRGSRAPLSPGQWGRMALGARDPGHGSPGRGSRDPGTGRDPGPGPKAPGPGNRRTGTRGPPKSPPHRVPCGASPLPGLQDSRAPLSPGAVGPDGPWSPGPRTRGPGARAPGPGAGNRDPGPGNRDPGPGPRPGPREPGPGLREPMWFFISGSLSSRDP